MKVSYGFCSHMDFPWGVQVVDHCRLVFHVPTKEVCYVSDSIDFPPDDKLVEIVSAMERGRMASAPGSMMTPEWVDSFGETT
jgi:hypothetical protein